jgi:thiol-disulfide isomerase/thioredoxin
MRKLAAEAADLPATQVDSRLLERIHERAAAGESVLLPVDDLGAAKPRRQWMAAASVALTAVAIGTVWSVNSATGSAAASVLEFKPARIQAGPIDVRYKSGALFGNVSRLVLRARYRTKWSEPYQNASRQQSVAALLRISDGVYGATLRIPDSILYAAFSVEDENGAVVDDNAHQLWNLSRQAPNGHPLSEAMTQRSNDLMGENMELSMRVLQQQSRFYSDSPSVWGSVMAVERFQLGQAHDDSTEASNCDRLKQFDSFYRENLRTTTHDADAIVKFSVQFDDAKCAIASPVGKYWRERVLNDSSGALEALERRYSRDAGPAFSDPKRSLALVDKYWPAPGFFGTMLANNATSAARQASDGPAALKWADRVVAKMPGIAPGLYASLVRLPGVHAAVLDRLRATLHRLQTRQDSLRPLELSVAAQARLDSAAAGQVLAAIGKALIADGKKQAGLDTLRLAASSAWDPRLFRQLSDAMLSLGDTAGALNLLARVAADPSTQISVTDSITRFAGARIAPQAWTAMLDSARSTLRVMLLADAIALPLKGKVRLQALDGRKLDLAGITRGRVAVVSFWSRSCGFSVQQFPMLASLARQLDERGIALVPVLNEKPSRDLQKYVDGTHVTAPVFADSWGDATRAFHDFGTPIFFVVDAAGRIRYRYSTLAQVLTQAVAIRDESSGAR